MPIAFWRLLLNRMQHWHSGQHCRAVFIAKDGPAKNGGSAEAGRMRPISVFCGVYRALISVWASHPDTRQWLDDIYFGEFYGGIRARSAGQAIRRLEKAWDDDAILLSLDFSLCFDYVRPELAVKALELHGAPAELLVVLK